MGIAHLLWRSMTLITKGAALMLEPHQRLGEIGAQPWAAMELGGALLGDERRTKRLVSLASALADSSNHSLSEACGSWAATKGAYRFFDNEAVDPNHILAAHRLATVQRAGEYPMILAVQDTTIYSFTTHRAIRRLGPVGRSGDSTAGFLVHGCLAVSPDGVPLGLLGQEFWVRPELDGTPRSGWRKDLPTEEKESVRWQRMMETIAKGLPAATLVLTVADREADVLDFFLTAVRLGQDVLVRAVYNRRLSSGQAYLGDAAEQAPLVGHLFAEIPRKDEQPCRTARLELRIATVTLRPPKNRRKRDALAPVAVHAVLAKETYPPDDQTPIEWLLLATLPVSTEEDAANCVRWYAHRWKIERYFYTLKSGCRIEELQFEDVKRFHHALAVYSVVAWRLLHLTYLARRQPDQPCTACLTASEWQALYWKIHRSRHIPDAPPNVQTAILWIARLGGFLARKGDGAPGVKVLWRGYRRLQNLASVWEQFSSS